MEAEKQQSTQNWERWAQELGETTSLPNWSSLMFLDAMTGGCMRQGLEVLKRQQSPFVEIHDSIMCVLGTGRCSRCLMRTISSAANLALSFLALHLSESITKTAIV